MKSAISMLIFFAVYIWVYYNTFYYWYVNPELTTMELLLQRGEYFGFLMVFSIIVLIITSLLN